MIINKQTGKMDLYSRLTLLAKNHGYSYDNLFYHFVRKGKEKRFEDENHIIQRVEWHTR